MAVAEEVDRENDGGEDQKGGREDQQAAAAGGAGIESFLVAIGIEEAIGVGRGQGAAGRGADGGSGRQRRGFGQVGGRGGRNGGRRRDGGGFGANFGFDPGEVFLEEGALAVEVLEALAHRGEREDFRGSRRGQNKSGGTADGGGACGAGAKA